MQLGTLPALPEDCVFALDIGTRSVIGIVGRQKENLFELMAVESREHPQRTMIDGQIQDIRQVARIAGQVKETLEERLGFSLNKVNVAAAGRALKTGRAEFSMDLPAEPVTPRQVYDLEMGAISLIRDQVAQQHDDSLSYYCVGHSVVRYYLDDYPFSTIVGHKGAQARADVIATFLPAEVIDSLCATMAIIGCEITHMTLEPIAAMNAVIPAELRLLNLALVDIGAGTSDIAISENGSVSAYTMATIAGDEVTEELIRRYLVDFQTAERMKHDAARGEEIIAYQDILGFDYTVPLKELLTSLRPAVESLSSIICDKILEANGKPPAAAFLVGGGSLVPMLCECVADGLGLDRKKVAVGGNNFIQRVAAGADEIAGPEYATPLGIALTAVAEGSQHGFYLYINGKKTRLFRNENISVMDALLLCGYRYHQLLGHNGRNITYQFNGKKQILRGGYLTPAHILVNGMESSITAPVNNEDRVDLTPAHDGEDAYLTLSMLDADPIQFTVYLGGMPIKAGREVTINGEAAQEGQEIHDHDVVVCHEILTLRDLCGQLGIAASVDAFQINGEHRGLDTLLVEGDRITPVSPPKEPAPQPEPEPEPPAEPEPPEQEPERPEPPVTVPEVAPHIIPEAEPMQVPEVEPMPVPGVETVPVPEVTPVTVPDGDTVPVPEPMPQPFSTPSPTAKKPSWAEIIERAWAEETPVLPVQEPAPAPTPDPVPVPEAAPAPVEPERPGWNLRPSIKITLNGDSVRLDPKPTGGYQFLDMLNLVDIDPTKPQGNIVLRLNGRNASYLDDIRNGDEVEIRWDTNG